MHLRGKMRDMSWAAKCVKAHGQLEEHGLMRDVEHIGTRHIQWIYQRWAGRLCNCNEICQKIKESSLNYPWKIAKSKGIIPKNRGIIPKKNHSSSFASLLVFGVFSDSPQASPSRWSAESFGPPSFFRWVEEHSRAVTSPMFRPELLLLLTFINVSLHHYY